MNHLVPVKCDLRDKLLVEEAIVLYMVLKLRTFFISAEPALVHVVGNIDE
jgi:hypothetical protein